MNKRISTQPHCFVSVVGPAGSGKTRLIGRMIVNQAKIFSPSLDKFIYFYNHYQEHYGTILMNCESTHVDIEFIQGLEWKSLEIVEAQKKRILLVLDDLFEEAAKSKEFLALVIAGRHRNIHHTSNQSIFPRSCWTRNRNKAVRLSAYSLVHCFGVGKI